MENVTKKLEKADEFDNSRIDAVRRLNEIAEKNKY